MSITDPRLGTTVAGRYRLEGQLGAGGMGVVYRGTHLASGRPVAVKFLHDSFASEPGLVRRFQREAKALGRLRHPNIVGILDSGLDGHLPFLVMDFLPGEPLARLLERGALPLPRAVWIARQVLAGVEHAHAQGVVHRDLKPDNILLVGVEGFVKILDFGLAKLVHGTEDSTRLTHTGSTFGTPAHMAPEQARGAPTDRRTDLYSIGVILYEMVVGRRPFVAESPMAVLRMHMDEVPVPPRVAAPDAGISAALESAIMRALEKEPDQRWQSAALFAAALASTPEGAQSGIPSLTDLPLAEISMVELDDGDRSVDAEMKETRPAMQPAETPDRKSSIRMHLPVQRRRPWAALALLALVAGAAYGWTRLAPDEQRAMRRDVDRAGARTKKAWRVLFGEEAPGRARSKVASGSTLDDAEAKRTAAARAPSAPAGSAPVATKAVPSAATPAPPTAPALDEDDGSDDRDANDGPGPPPPSDTPGAQLEARSAAPPSLARTSAQRRPPRLRDAKRLLAAGRVDDAILVAYQLRRASVAGPDVALLLGHAYFRKLWRTDGLREYDAALAARPVLRRDPLLVRNAVVALEDPTFRAARALVKTRLGPAALPELRRAARDGRNAKLKARATRLVAALKPLPKPKSPKLGKRKK